MDPRVGHQVGLELVQVDIESSVKPEAGRDGGDDLSNQTVEVGVGWSIYFKIVSGDVVDGLIVHQEGAVTVLQGGLGVEDGVVRLHDGC